MPSASGTAEAFQLCVWVRRTTQPRDQRLTSWSGDFALLYQRQFTLHNQSSARRMIVSKLSLDQVRYLIRHNLLRYVIRHDRHSEHV